MRLTGIKLAGFKSFVDPTILPLPTNLTGVVGPNGSGKSNLIDAVRWVLGESSAKSLRGTESEDVIFNGSKARKPAGRASVELQFDNADGSLQGAWSAYAEIAVRRELVRGEGSRYFINGQKCLKRDVVDLFLGTGLGGRSQYAILEQGTISRLVEAKPDELRLWLEEAAGVSRYKDRRRETETRIRQTRENLERLDDLRGEIGKRLTVLTRQAADAEKYRESKKQERILKVEMLLLKRRGLTDALGRQQAVVVEMEGRLEAARGALAEAGEAQARTDRAMRESEQVLNTLQGEVYQAEAALSREQQALAHAREVKALCDREMQEIRSQIAEVEDRRERETRHCHALEQALRDTQAETASTVEREHRLSEEAGQAEERLRAEETRWETFNQRAQAPMLQAEGERARQQSLERAGQQLDERDQRLRKERDTLDDAPLQAALFDADSELAALQEAIDRSRTTLEDQDNTLQAQRERRAAVESSLHEARHLLANARGRKASLETLQQAALREDDAGLGDWLQVHGWSGQPRLAATIRVAEGWEAAVEHVLSGLLQASLLTGWSSPLAPLQGPPGGAVLAAAQHPSEPPSGSLADCVEGAVVVREWLGSIYPARDGEEAVARLQKLGAGESVITPDGVWRGRGWVRYPRSEDGQSGVIARGQLLRELEAVTESQAAVVQSLEGDVQRLNAERQALEAARRDNAAGFDRARSRHGQCLAEREARSVRLEQMRGRGLELTTELDMLAGQRAENAQAVATTRQRLSELERIVAALLAERDELTLSLAQARERAQRARHALQDAALERSRAQVRVATEDSALAAARQALEDIGVRLNSLGERQRARTAGRSDLDRPIVEGADKVERAQHDVTDARGRLQAARSCLTQAQAEAESSQRAWHAAESGRDTALERLQQARVGCEAERARSEAMDAQIAETGEDIRTLDASLDAGADIEAWEQKLGQVQRRLERLGAINLAAIPELEQARERADYLDAQHRDLDEALATLEDAMCKLDRETQDLFRATFERVDANFRNRYPRLFGGGEAGLELVGDDWLSSGVRVMARPPGKRNATIQLLSGGEKALTALALLFALFELNPAPFCLLDEVEAPLDDANVGRFCDLVREMSKNVEFLVITHNKITMELTEHLHGVTMQEPGVSRLVSVDMRQAAAFVDEPGEMAEV